MGLDGQVEVKLEVKALCSRETRRFPRAFRVASANYSFPLIIDRDFPNQRRQEKRSGEGGGGSRGNANKTHVQLTNWQITSERWRRKPVGLGHGHMPAGGDAVHPVESPSAPPPSTLPDLGLINCTITTRN